MATNNFCSHQSLKWHKIAASVPNLGQVAGSLSAGLMADKIGRKYSLMLYCIPLISGWILMIFSSGNVVLMIASRTLKGFGMMPSLCQLYMMELLTMKNKGGILGTAFAVSTSIGITMTYVLGTFLPWEIVCWTFVMVAVILALGLTWFPDSPVWLVQKGQLEKAAKSLYKTRGQTYKIHNELEDLKSCFIGTKSGSSIKDLFKPESYKPLMILMTLWILQQFCGNFAVIFYAVDVFSGIGVEDAMKEMKKMMDLPSNGTHDGSAEHIDEGIHASNLAAIGVGVMRIVSSIFGAILASRYSKKGLMVLSSILMTISMSSLSLTVYYKYQYMDVEWLRWLPILETTGFILAYGVGMNNIPFILLGLLCPANIKAISSSLSITICAISVFVVVKLFPWGVYAFGPHVIYGFFSVVSFLSVIFSILMLPNTEGKTLKEMQEIYKSS